MKILENKEKSGIKPDLFILAAPLDLVMHTPGLRPQKLRFCMAYTCHSVLTSFVITHSEPRFNPGVTKGIKKHRINRCFLFLAAQDITNLNRLIEQTINIAESLMDVDFALYARYNRT